MLLLAAPSGALLAPTGLCSRTDAVTAHATTQIARTAPAVASASAAAELAADFSDLPEGTDYICPRVRERWPGASLPPLVRPTSAPADAPPPSTVLMIPDFLSADECERLIAAGQEVADRGEECGEYLNARVNSEVGASGASSEADELLASFTSEMVDSDGCKLSMTAESGGGFRVRAPQELVRELLEERVLAAMDLRDRSDGFHFDQRPFVRPTPRRVLIKDQTIVRYEGAPDAGGEGDGVPPHVDGKDATLLLYLNTVEEGAGGRTVFPEDGLAVAPKRGTALIYRSKTELLHFSEPVTKPGVEKAILQLLIDYRHAFKKGETVTDFETGASYVYE